MSLQDSWNGHGIEIESDYQELDDEKLIKTFYGLEHEAISNPGNPVVEAKLEAVQREIDKRKLIASKKNTGFTKEEIFESVSTGLPVGTEGFIGNEMVTVSAKHSDGTCSVVDENGKSFRVKESSIETVEEEWVEASREVEVEEDQPAAVGHVKTEMEYPVQEEENIEPCPYCEGSGNKAGSSSELCSKCKGTGKLKKTAGTDENQFTQIPESVLSESYEILKHKKDKGILSFEEESDLTALEGEMKKRSLAVNYPPLKGRAC